MSAPGNDPRASELATKLAATYRHGELRQWRTGTGCRTLPGELRRGSTRIGCRTPSGEPQHRRTGVGCETLAGALGGTA